MPTELLEIISMTLGSDRGKKNINSNNLGACHS